MPTLLYLVLFTNNSTSTDLVQLPRDQWYRKYKTDSQRSNEDLNPHCDLQHNNPIFTKGIQDHDDIPSN